MSFLRSLQAKVLLAALIPGSIILIIVAVIALFHYGATVLESRRRARLEAGHAFRISAE